MSKLTGMFLILLGIPALALAVPIDVPEVSATGAVNVVALLSTTVLMIRSRRKKK